MMLVQQSYAKAKLAAVSGVVLGLWLGLDPLIRTLIVLIGLDLISGLIYAWTSGKISSDASMRGMAKKALMLILVGAAHVYNGAQSLGFDAASLVAGFFCTTEFISIVENCGRVGIPIPKPIKVAIEKLNKQLDQETTQ